jgi:hypothetical protein
MLSTVNPMTDHPITPHMPDPDPSQWRVVATNAGIALREHGEGTPVIVFPGMEGSGESCLHLAYTLPCPRWLPRQRLAPLGA